MDPSGGRPDAPQLRLQELLARLVELTALEPKYTPNLQLPASGTGGEVTVGIRDGTAHVLRCLKVWYDMPPEVLFVSLNLVDRFLTKMKARPKHMACIAIASFQLAAGQVCRGGGAAGADAPPVPEPIDVAAISQCKCTVGDLARMQGIITNKLGSQDGTLPITAIDFLRNFHELFLCVDEGHVYSSMVDWAEMCQKLEIAACDAAVANFRPCVVALVIVCVQMDAGVTRFACRAAAAPQPSPSPPPHRHVTAIVNFAGQLQQICKIEEYTFYECHEAVMSIIGRYNAQRQMPHRQRLVWKLSHRTLRRLRPTDRLVNTLPTIDEHTLTRSDSTSSDESWTAADDEEWGAMNDAV